MPRPKLIDVSHIVEEEMITYKGLPAPIICDFLSREESRTHYAPGTEKVKNFGSFPVRAFGIVD
jgi:kynurenine formamidase